MDEQKQMDLRSVVSVLLFLGPAHVSYVQMVFLNMWWTNKVLCDSVCNAKSIFTAIMNNRVELQRLVIFRKPSAPYSLQNCGEKGEQKKYYVKWILYFTQLPSKSLSPANVRAACINTAWKLMNCRVNTWIVFSKICTSQVSGRSI